VNKRPWQEASSIFLGLLVDEVRAGEHARDVRRLAAAVTIV
jgi:hypothetical protein